MTFNTASNYRRDIDGLRGIAVLLVVFFHAGLPVQGGFVGVDVFFVISGYLITGILLHEMEMGSFDLISFWERRIRRIVPASVVMTLGTLAIGYAVQLPDAYAKLGESVVAQVLLTSNIYFCHDSGYFTASSEEKPLLHTWSLAVEEQFYLLLPLTCCLICYWWRKKESKTSLRSLCFKVFFILFTLSLIWSSVLVFLDINTAFFSLHSRAWELLTGCLIASLPEVWRSAPQKWRSRLCFTGFGLLLTSAFVCHDDMLFPGITAVLPCLAAALLIWTNPNELQIEHSHNVVSRLLRSKALVGLGLISYSLYLWHWPLIAFWEYLDPGFDKQISLLVRLFVVLIAFLFAWFSWRWVETPFRKRPKSNSRHLPLFTCTAVILGAILLCGRQLVLNEGLPSRVSERALSYFEGHNALSRRGWPDDFDAVLRHELPRFGVTDPSQPVRVLLWGDSHAKSLALALDAICLDRKVSGFIASYSATPPLDGFVHASPSGLSQRSSVWFEAVLEIIRTQHIPDTILAVYWAKYSGKREQQFSDALLRTVNRLREAGTRVWIVLDVPAQKLDVPLSLALHAMHPTLYPDPRTIAVSRAEYLLLNNVMEKLIPKLKAAGAHLLDPTKNLFNQDGRSLIEKDGSPLYGDSHHLILAGALQTKESFTPVFEE